MSRKTRTQFQVTITLLIVCSKKRVRGSEGASAPVHPCAGATIFYEPKKIGAPFEVFVVEVLLRLPPAVTVVNKYGTAFPKIQTGTHFLWCWCCGRWFQPPTPPPSPLRKQRTQVDDSYKCPAARVPSDSFTYVHAIFVGRRYLPIPWPTTLVHPFMSSMLAYLIDDAKKTNNPN